MSYFHLCVQIGFSKTIPEVTGNLKMQIFYYEKRGRLVALLRHTEIAQSAVTISGLSFTIRALNNYLLDVRQRRFNVIRLFSNFFCSKRTSQRKFQR